MLIAAIAITGYLLVGVLMALLIEWRLRSDQALHRYATDHFKPMAGKPGGIQKLSLMLGLLWPALLIIVACGAAPDDDDDDLTSA